MAAFHYLRDDQIFRAGERSDLIADTQLREISRTGVPLSDATSSISILPVEVGRVPIGSLGLQNGSLSIRMLHAVAERFGIAIERSRVIEDEALAVSARKIQELKSVLLDGLAHQLKSPLAVIKIAATTVLSRNQELSPAVAELMKVLDEETTHLEQTVEEALQIARVDAGLLNLEKAPYQVRDLVYVCLQETSEALRGRPLEIHLPDDLPPAQFDFHILKLVINDLLRNAAKYSPSGAPLVVSSQVVKNAVVISIADSGIGVGEEDRNRIFDKCYRGRRVRQDIPGNGIGLAIAKGIVEAHDGEIWVTSQPGKGSVFSFSLPV